MSLTSVEGGAEIENDKMNENINHQIHNLYTTTYTNLHHTTAPETPTKDTLSNDY